MEGYKVFSSNWTCKNNFKYIVGETYVMDKYPKCCNVGFHFCEKLIDCFSYYDFDPDNKVAMVEAFGDIDSNGSGKFCTNKIRIVRELSWHECLNLINSGTGNSGLGNSGNRNSGDRNSGDRNYANYSAGCFNSETQTIMMFNKPSSWTFNQWIRCDARYYLNEIPKNVVEWIYSSDMTDEEKELHPEHETTGGYLKVLDEFESAQLWWDGASKYKRNAILSLPNFDAKVFEKCTGIKVADD